MKNKTQKYVNKVTGFTLPEFLIFLAVFSILVFLGPINFLQSKKLAHENLMHDSVRTAVQSYLEQIKETQLYTIKLVMADSNNVPLRIESLSSPRPGETIKTSDVLFLNRVNHKKIPLVTQYFGEEEYDTETMDLFVTPSVERFKDSDDKEVLEFTLEYFYESNFKGLKETHDGIVHFTKSSVSEL